MATIEQTLSIIKPDGVEKKVIGDVLSRFESAGLRITAMKMIHMDKALNDEYSQRKMLKFVGFKNPVIRLGIKLQSNEKPVGGKEDKPRFTKREQVCLELN